MGVAAKISLGSYLLIRQDPLCVEPQHDAVRQTPKKLVWDLTCGHLPHETPLTQSMPAFPEMPHGANRDTCSKNIRHQARAFLPKGIKTLC